MVSLQICLYFIHSDPLDDRFRWRGNADRRGCLVVDIELPDGIHYGFQFKNTMSK